MKNGQDYLCYSFFAPPPDPKRQAPIRVMRTRIGVHADACGDCRENSSRDWYRWIAGIRESLLRDLGGGYYRIHDPGFVC